MQYLLLCWPCGGYNCFHNGPEEEMPVAPMALRKKSLLSQLPMTLRGIIILMTGSSDKQFPKVNYKDPLNVTMNVLPQWPWRGYNCCPFGLEGGRKKHLPQWS